MWLGITRCATESRTPKYTVRQCWVPHRSLTTYLSIYLSIYLPIYLSIYLCLWLPQSFPRGPQELQTTPQSSQELPGAPPGPPELPRVSPELSQSSPELLRDLPEGPPDLPRTPQRSPEPEIIGNGASKTCYYAGGSSEIQKRSGKYRHILARCPETASQKEPKKHPGTTRMVLLCRRERYSGKSEL